ncbi:MULTISPECIES: hypothetical protein [Flavobacterium]|uniref:hypothetical protein n=1 Tax=Flavobacterium TaxID=237 RepID=UPI001FCC2B31|nr:MULTISPECIES: hypothetical protein [Flavobacterium]UOK42652.1 hypothetical protein LZF87_00630 [Flavobacterium enshiense]
MKTKQLHTFHIPVMGLSYTIDSPIRVAHYGISSVIAITDDEILEKLRAFYCDKFNIPYLEITQKTIDYRAKRITAYLNMVNDTVKEKFQNFKSELLENKTTLENFISLLPNTSDLKINLEKVMNEGSAIKKNIQNFLEDYFSPGSIDVNIMTKVDKDNYENDVQLPVEFNDAHASLRGFAQSELNSSVVFSAGMNPRLFSYIENFKDFFPDTHGKLKKKIILKVSDYRSALIQGNFLAKKGLWVSEYRIESGLNCGGHAFATDGFLMGPILEEFKEKKDQLIQSAHELLIKALTLKELYVPTEPMELKITAQGGIGTAEEHDFLLEHYNLDSVGWGSPFLLVPEATSLDKETRNILAKAKEDDFYLSNISPLGVPFNSVKGVSNDFWKQKRIDQNKAGSSCPKRLLALNKEYDHKGLCTASKKFQDIKLDELKAFEKDLLPSEIDKRKNAITEKSCLCVGLVNAAYLENNIEIKGQQQGVVICPGPNLAYFDKEVSLAEMVRHIYGNGNIITDKNRPHVFVKELKMYVEYLKKEINDFSGEITAGQTKKWNSFKTNLLAGIDYYQNLFSSTKYFKSVQQDVQQQLTQYRKELAQIEVFTLEMA